MKVSVRELCDLVTVMESETNEVKRLRKEQNDLHRYVTRLERAMFSQLGNERASQLVSIAKDERFV